MLCLRPHIVMIKRTSFTPHFVADASRAALRSQFLNKSVFTTNQFTIEYIFHVIA